MENEDKGMRLPCRLQHLAEHFESIPRRPKRRNRQDLGEWDQYKSRVRAETRLQPLHTLANYGKRSAKGWHVDHVLSIAEGFRLGLPPETVGHISNLRMVPYKENLSKSASTVFTNLFNE